MTASHNGAFVKTSDGREWFDWKRNPPPTGQVVWRWSFAFQSSAYKWIAGQCRDIGYWSPDGERDEPPTVNPFEAAK